MVVPKTFLDTLKRVQLKYYLGNFSKRVCNKEPNKFIINVGWNFNIVALKQSIYSYADFCILLFHGPHGKSGLILNTQPNYP